MRDWGRWTTTGRSRAATILYHGQRDLRQIPFRCWSAEKHGSIIHRRVLILAPESTKPCVLDGVSALAIICWLLRLIVADRRRPIFEQQHVFRESANRLVRRGIFHVLSLILRFI